MYVKKADLTEHLEKECKCRLETCEYCKRQINLNKMKVQCMTKFHFLELIIIIILNLYPPADSLFLSKTVSTTFLLTC